MEKINFAKVRDVKSPLVSTTGSAGIDFFVPNDFIDVALMSGEDILIPSGIKMNLPEGKVLISFNKSGISTKKKLIIGACVIDSDYQGEIHIHLINYSNTVAKIQAGDKIAQFILLDFHQVELLETHESDLFNKESQRGSGGFGSTN